MTILCAYDKEYYMRKDTTWHCNCKQLAFLLPLASWRGRITVRRFPVLTILSLVRPTVQSESHCPAGSVIPQHNTAIVKWPGVNQAPILWCCPHLASSWVPSSDSTDPGNNRSWRRQLSPVGQVADTHKHVRTETFWTQTDFSRNCIDLVNSVLSHYCFSSVCPSYN